MGRHRPSEGTVSAFHFQKHELGIVVLALYSMEATDHRDDFLAFRRRMTKAAMEMHPSFYEEAIRRGAIDPYEPDDVIAARALVDAYEAEPLPAPLHPKGGRVDD